MKLPTSAALFSLLVIALCSCEKPSSRSGRDLRAAQQQRLIDDRELEANLNNRVNYLIQLYGSVERLEKQSGKTIAQIKDEWREIMRETMLADKPLHEK